MKPASFYRQKLADLDIFQKSLTAEQFRAYAPRIQLIKNIASKQALLRSRDTPYIPVLDTPPDKKPTKSKKDHAKEVYTSYTAYLSNIKPNAKVLPPEVIEKARMAKASAIYHDDGFNKANQYLEQQGIDYNIDRGLSTDFSLVLTKKTDTPGAIPEDIKIAYRGTKYNNLQDMVTNAGVLTGTVKRTPQSNRAKEQMLQVIEKYGQKPSELVSFSKGSVHGINLGEEFNIRTTNFNPFIGPGMIDKTVAGDHHVFTTVGDMPSIGIAAKSESPNFRVTVTEPRNDSVLPNKIHSIDNFTMAHPRQSEEVRTERIKVASKAAKRLADAESIVKIHNFRNGKVGQPHKDFINVDSQNGSFSFRDKIPSVSSLGTSLKSGLHNIRRGGINIANDLAQRFGSKPLESISGVEMTELNERSKLLGGDEFEDSSSFFDIEPGTSVEMPEVNEVPKQNVLKGQDEYFRSIIGDEEGPIGFDDTQPFSDMMGPSSSSVDGPVSVPTIEGAPQPPRAQMNWFGSEPGEDNIGEIFGPVVSEAPRQGEVDLTDPAQMRDLEERFNLINMDSDTTSPLEDLWLRDNNDLVQEANIKALSESKAPVVPPEVDSGPSGRTFTEYIHNLGAGGTEVLENGTVKLDGDGFKQQRYLWEQTGGGFTEAEKSHFAKYPLNDSQETFLEPEEISHLQTSDFNSRRQMLSEMSADVRTSMKDVHGSTTNVTEPTSFGRGVRNFGTSGVIGLVSQGIVDKGMDAFDPKHEMQEDERQGISGFLGGGLGEMGILRLSGAAITAESVLPVAIGAGAGAVVGYETDKWFRENAPDQVYLRNISSNMAGMGTAGAITGTMLGGPVGGAVGGLIGLGTGFVVGSAEYLYNKYL